VDPKTLAAPLDRPTAVSARGSPAASRAPAGRATRRSPARIPPAAGQDGRVRPRAVLGLVEVHDAPAVAGGAHGEEGAFDGDRGAETLAVVVARRLEGGQEVNPLAV